MCGVCWLIEPFLVVKIRGPPLLGFGGVASDFGLLATVEESDIERGLMADITESRDYICILFRIEEARKESLMLIEDFSCEKVEIAVAAAAVTVPSTWLLRCYCCCCFNWLWFLLNIYFHHRF